MVCTYKVYVSKGLVEEKLNLFLRPNKLKVQTGTLTVTRSLTQAAVLMQYYIKK